MLRETVEWSLELLAPAERGLFDGVLQFAHGFDRAAVEAICAGDGLEADDIGAALECLLEAGLVQPSAVDGNRLEVSNTLREEAGELPHAGETPQMQLRLLEWALARALEGVAHLLSTAGLALMRGGDAMQARRYFLEVGRIAANRCRSASKRASTAPRWRTCRSTR